MDIELERKFLHDIASPLGICIILIKTSLADLEKTPPGENSELIASLIKRLTKIDDALARVEAMHANHKMEISVP